MAFTEVDHLVLEELEGSEEVQYHTTSSSSNKDVSGKPKR